MGSDRLITPWKCSPDNFSLVGIQAIAYSNPFRGCGRGNLPLRYGLNFPKYYNLNRIAIQVRTNTVITNNLIRETHF